MKKGLYPVEALCESSSGDHYTWQATFIVSNPGGVLVNTVGLETFYPLSLSDSLHSRNLSLENCVIDVFVVAPPILIPEVEIRERKKRI